MSFTAEQAHFLRTMVGRLSEEEALSCTREWASEEQEVDRDSLLWELACRYQRRFPDSEEVREEVCCAIAVYCYKHLLAFFPQEDDSQSAPLGAKGFH